MRADAVPLVPLVLVFCSGEAVGSLLTLALYGFNWQRFIASGLLTKIVAWVPIFLAFLVVLYLPNPLRLVVLAAIVATTAAEVGFAVRDRESLDVGVLWVSAMTIALVHFIAIGLVFASDVVTVLIAVCVGAAFSDICAFFFGRYFGAHALPRNINDQKSWEGFVGQIVGALIGVVTINACVHTVPIGLFVPIGIGSGLGDIANSAIKRSVGVESWSRLIPGHGGLADRISSIAGSALLTFYFLLLTRPNLV
jgi:phosphatidate cytidylyltransferase